MARISQRCPCSWKATRFCFLSWASVTTRASRFPWDHWSLHKQMVLFPLSLWARTVFFPSQDPADFLICWPKVLAFLRVQSHSGANSEWSVTGGFNPFSSVAGFMDISTLTSVEGERLCSSSHLKDTFRCSLGWMLETFWGHSSWFPGFWSSSELSPWDSVVCF